MEKERAKMAKDDGKEHEADEGGDGPRVPRKSKFVSDPFLALTAKWFPLKTVNTFCVVVLLMKGHQRSLTVFSGTCIRTVAMIAFPNDACFVY